MNSFLSNAGVQAKKISKYLKSSKSTPRIHALYDIDNRHVYFLPQIKISLPTRLVSCTLKALANVNISLFIFVYQTFKQI